ncbi:MAG: 30S ribosomal protein S6 [Candidatus Margulisbacteria bacterium]|nr:30S ribosomal protein S6 [Candidatus Margulisiibacteriota bacterium]
MNSYELILIFDSALGDEKIDALVAKIEGKIKGLGGEIEKTDKWGSKRLASQMKKAKKVTMAHYVLIYFQSATSLPAELSSYLKVTEELIRYSIVRAGEKPAEGEAEAISVGEIKGEAVGES